ncbi:YaiI/YqxD family protein [Haliovirga abyssi]|uniref:UPF0178 protein HLVA_22800 n=1 Tax=Haliovirga abyssi TaxID=2996794 RepID=A0AAU9DDW2_9FUSO|nr:YaiI/YqxD family protein [Haliovirga abyssi]BDU51711.1 DUF188 domain-containing protein [Haliovirga abyssi]
MRIIIDADATPKNAKLICEQLAKKYELELIMVIDNAHELTGDFKVIKVDKGKDSVDLEIVKISKNEDIIITQDYGLATILIEKVYAVIHPKGMRYTKFNIESLMFQRHMGQKMRNAGKRTKGPKKRERKDDQLFEENLMKILKEYF